MGSKRKKIGLCYVRGYESSTALAIYIQNIIKALNLLPDDTKPLVYLFYTEAAPIDDIKSILYPYIKYVLVDFKPPYVQLNPLQRAVNRFLMTIGQKPFYNPQKKKVEKKVELDILYPNWIEDENVKVKKRINWVIDFQELHLPHFFTEKELPFFHERIKRLAHAHETVVVSSFDAKKDFLSMEPDYTCPIKVLQFASMFDYQSILMNEAVLEKYHLTKSYFITPNQFWPHKNHILILKAAKILFAQGYSFQVVFTGMPSSYRDSSYGDNLVRFVEENKLVDCVSFLGFLPRIDMLSLVKKSNAIIQPSLFEGWSTLVEEAKALSHTILLSDLKVHREQISENCAFFDVNNAEQLAELMKQVLDFPVNNKKVDYNKNIEHFLNSIVDILELNN